MINIMYAVDPIKRIVKPMSGHAVTEQDHEASSLRFAFPDNIAGTGLDSTGAAVRVMYIRPDGGDPVAKTLTFYKHSGGYYLYDWNLQKSDLQKEGRLVFSLCVLSVSEGIVSEEWHTTPYQIRVLGSIHTDDSDEGDETITPTVAQRVAVLESVVQRVASGAPIVVASTSAMTDTSQIYVLSTNGNWYYHNGTTWVSGGEYGAVSTDTTLTQSGIPADAEAVGDVLDSVHDDIFVLENRVTTQTGNIGAYKERTDARLEAVDGIRTVPFEMGGVNIIGNTMSKRDATNRMRSVSPVPLYSGDTLTVDEGYEFYLDKYVDNTWSDLVSWRTSYTVTDDGDYEIVVRLTDNSDITDTDEASESVIFSNNPNSAFSDISANAQQIESLKDVATDLYDNISETIARLEAVDGIRTVPFEMGTVAVANNVILKQNATNRIRSVSPVSLYSGDTLNSDVGYEFYLYKYVDNTWSDLVSWRTSYTVIDNGEYEVIVRIADNSDITNVNTVSESLNFSINPNSAVFDISTNAQQIESLKDVATDLYDNILETTERTVDSSASGYEILSNGLSRIKGACKINKYLVTAGERLRITSDGYFQFQAQSNVSSVEPSSRLNDITYQPGVYTLTVPDNATYLALSTTVSDSSAEVVSLASKIDNLENAIESNAENIDELFEKIGYKQFVDFTNGYYIAGSVGGSVDIRPASACSYSTTPLFAEVGQVVHCKTQGTGLACISVSETNNIADAICVVAGANNTGIVEATYEMQSDGYVWVSARTAVLEAWIETPKSTELITKVNSLTTKTDDLLSEVFDCNGTAIVRNIDFPSGNAYIELMRVNLKAGVAYTFSATIEKMQTANVYVYFYITNNNGENIGGGSVFGIKSDTDTAKTASTTKTFDTSYENAVFRVKCHIGGTVKSAEITYVKTDSENAIPDYYYADNYLPNKVSRINTLAQAAGSSGDVFVFITDMHWNSNAKHSPELIKYIVERSQIYRLFDGGDDENGGLPDLAKKLRECMGSGKAYFTMGNHEYVGAVGSELYYMYDGANNDQIGNPERHYYYVDDVQVKTRYIVMSAFRENGSGSNTVGYEADQITWLTTVALNVNSGWHIIIFSHCVYTSQRLGTEWILPAWAEPFVNAIDSYSGNGKIVCVFQGDHHADGINYTPNGIPVIATSCDKYQHWMVDGADMEPYLNDRVGNTVWEQSFDVVIHNKTTKTIYCVRIGGFANLTGGNEALFEAGERVVTYT